MAYCARDLWVATPGSVYLIWNHVLCMGARDETIGKIYLAFQAEGMVRVTKSRDEFGGSVCLIKKIT
jgi:hypothetical protein